MHIHHIDYIYSIYVHAYTANMHTRYIDYIYIYIHYMLMHMQPACASVLLRLQSLACGACHASVAKHFE